MFMQAIVLEVQWERLLVLDQLTRQNVIVNTPDAQRFRRGDFVGIWYSGAMTNSIPPQIYAQRITLLPSNAFPPVAQPPIFFPPVVRPPSVILPPLFPPHRRPPNRPGHRPPRHRR